MLGRVVLGIVIAAATVRADPATRLNEAFATRDRFLGSLADPVFVTGLAFSTHACNAAFGVPRKVPRAEQAALYDCLRADHARFLSRDTDTRVDVVYRDTWVVIAAVRDRKIAVLFPSTPSDDDADLPTYFADSADVAIPSVTASRFRTMFGEGDSAVKVCTDDKGVVIDRRTANGPGRESPSELDRAWLAEFAEVSHLPVRTQGGEPAAACALFSISTSGPVAPPYNGHAPPRP